MAEQPLERTQYASSILVAHKPIDATEIVRVRLSQAKLLNDEFSNFFKKYYQIKSDYLDELTALVKSSQDLNKNIERGILENNVLSQEELQYYNVDAIGHLSEIWNKIIAEIRDEISANNTLRRVVEGEVIHPLTSYTTKNPQWSEMREMHAKLKEVAQNIEFSQEKVDKYRPNPAKFQEKLDKYEDQLQKSSDAWDVRAPYVFEVFENTDLSRLNFLRDSLLRFITAYTDSLNKISSSNEKTLETILNFNPEVEIERFAKVSIESTYIPKSAREAAESPRPPQSSSFNGNAGTATPTRSSANKNRMSSIAGSALGAASIMTGSSSGKDEKEKGRRRTKLKSKVGSIFGKKNKKNSKITPLDDDIPESETSSLNNSFRGPVGRESRASSFMAVPSKSSAPSHLNHSSSNLNMQQQKQTGQYARETSPQGQQTSQPQQQPQQQPLQPSSYRQEPLQPTHGYQQAKPVQNVAKEATTPFSINQEPLKPATVGQPSSASFSDVSSHINDTPVDSQSPQSFDNQEQHRAPPPPPSRKTGGFGSQNLSNIREDAPYSFDNTAHPPNGNSISHQVPHGSLPEPPVARRDIQSGLFTNLNAADYEANQNKRLSSYNSFASIPQLRPQNTGSSLSTTGLFQHPDMVSPGLNASIVEVVNAKFKDGEQVSSQVLGEVAFNYQDDGAAMPSKTNVKISGAELFGKIITNQQFLKQIDSNEFEISPSAIRERTVGGLKYSLKDTAAPLVVLPVWRFEPHQASVMLTIKLAPHVASQLGDGESVEISDLVVAVSIEGVAKSALSKPQGTFNKDKSRVSWRFKDPVKLTATSDQKLVARFMTDQEAKESDRGVVLKFTINDTASAQATLSNLSISAHQYDEEDPFAQEEWAPVPCFKTVVAGNYSGLAQ